MAINWQKSIFNIFLFIWIISIPFGNAIYQISTVLIVLYFVYYIVYHKDYNSVLNLIKKYKDLLGILLIICLSMITSNLFNNVSSDSWSLLLKNIYRYGFIIFILLFFYSKCFLNKKSILIYILISLSVILFDGIFQALTGYDFFKNMPGNIYSGLNGPIGNRNPFSFLMGIGLLITVFCNRNKNYLFYLLAVLFIFCILFSYSRTIWVSLFFSFVCYFIINFRSIDKKTIITLLSISVLLIVIFLNVDSLNHRFNALIDGNSSGRTNIWLSSLPLIKDQIFIGHGLNTMIDYKIWGGIYGMHNHTLEILFDLGILGLFSFVALLILILKELKFNKAKILFYLLVYFLINGIFGESIISSKLILSTLTIFVFFVFVDRIKLTKGKLI